MFWRVTIISGGSWRNTDFSSSKEELYDNNSDSTIDLGTLGESQEVFRQRIISCYSEHLVSSLRDGLDDSKIFSNPNNFDNSLILHIQTIQLKK